MVLPCLVAPPTDALRGLVDVLGNGVPLVHVEAGHETSSLSAKKAPEAVDPDAFQQDPRSATNL